MQHWNFTVLLGVIYLSVFHLWMHVDQHTIILSGLGATLLSSGLFLWAERRKYFFNHWDRLFHAAVILDILLEGLLVPLHDPYGFYFCAAAFALAVGGYRRWLLYRRKELVRPGQRSDGTRI